MLNRFSALVLALGIVIAAPLAGCNTVEGFGEDTEEIGDAISDEAREASD